MSEENVELVRAVLDAWNRGDDPGGAIPFAEDIEWLEIGGRPGFGASAEAAVEGIGTVQSGLDSLFDAWQSYRLEPEEVRPVGEDRVLAILREVARGRASGAEVASRWGYLITIDRGRLTRVEAYRDPSMALEAAGLDES